MTETRSDITDCDVSTQYRMHADESAPEDLDRKVLDAAANGLRRKGDWRDTWFRPLTLVATVGIAFAMALQLGDLSLSIGPPEQTDASPALQPDAFQDAGRANEARFDELQLESERSMQSAPDRQTPLMDAGSTPQASNDGNAQPESPQCSTEERQNATTWWDCVRELERNGDSQAAEVELQALLKAFPAFERPE